YMRLLYARVGRTFCRNCGREVVRETAEVVARQLGELPAGTRLLLGFDVPVVDASAPVIGDAPEVDELAEIADDVGADLRVGPAGGDVASDAQTARGADTRVRPYGSPSASAIAATIAVLR